MGNLLIDLQVVVITQYSIFFSMRTENDKIKLRAYHSGLSEGCVAVPSCEL